MSQRHEIHFVSAGRQIDASLQRAMKHLREVAGMMRRNLVYSPNRFFGPRMQPKDRSRSRQLEWQAALGKLSVEIVAKSRGLPFKFLIDILTMNLLQGRQAGAHSHGIRAQR